MDSFDNNISLETPDESNSKIGKPRIAESEQSLGDEIQVIDMENEGTKEVDKRQGYTEGEEIEPAIFASHSAIRLSTNSVLESTPSEGQENNAINTTRENEAQVVPLEKGIRVDETQVVQLQEGVRVDEAQVVPLQEGIRVDEDHVVPLDEGIRVEEVHVVPLKKESMEYEVVQLEEERREDNSQVVLLEEVTNEDEVVQLEEGDLEDSSSEEAVREYRIDHSYVEHRNLRPILKKKPNHSSYVSGASQTNISAVYNIRV